MKNTKNTAIVPLLGVALAAATLLAGCGFVQSKQDAEKVVTRHFQNIATNGYQTAMNEYGKEFFAQTPRDEWSKALAGLTEKLGTYQKHSVDGWRIFKNANNFGAGTTVTVQCQVKYSKHEAKETFILFKSVTDSDYKILGHQINSTGLLQ